MRDWERSRIDQAWGEQFVTQRAGSDISVGYWSPLVTPDITTITGKIVIITQASTDRNTIIFWIKSILRLVR